MSTTTCSECGLPMRLGKEEALKLNCQGMHFIDTGVDLIPVRARGLQVGKGSVLKEVDYDVDVQVGSYCDLYHCKVGAHTKIKNYVEVQGDVEIGKFCKIESFVFIPSGVKIGNYCFIGAKTIFINDKYPSAVGEWELKQTIIEDNVSIGAGAIIMPVKIGQGSLIGAGALVTKSIPADVIAYGFPARVVRPI